ncbi:MAG: type II toxin-antitoxin system RelE/ParE family toxin [Lachnospiraceae bacterium]|nr:type II toxin-antitoxin system RelE/ParE family toxin [Lachnospiraceae bacterium]
MGKYKVEYLPLAMKDMVDIAAYISGELCNPDAAQALAEQFVSCGDELAKYPYRNGVYVPAKKLKHEYRRVLVGHYGMYYWVDEEARSVTIARVIYQRRDMDRLLD